MCITSYIFCTLCNAVSWVYMLKRASRILVAKIPWHSLGFWHIKLGGWLCDLLSVNAISGYEFLTLHVGGGYH